MLNEICMELRNFFCTKEDKIIGSFSIANGALVPLPSFLSGQYYRIVGSIFNDGVHRSDDVLTDEPEFKGAVWLMRVPIAVIELAQEIEQWVTKYGGAEGVINSPYASESFGGYSYSKRAGSGGYEGSGGSDVTWQGVFAKRLNPYRRIRIL